MSRTYRNLQYAKFSAQQIAYANYRRQGYHAMLEIKEAGYEPDNRIKSSLSRIPTNWSDKHIDCEGA